MRLPSSLRTFIRGDFKVPIVNGLWHKLRMQDLLSVSIVNEFANAKLGDRRLHARLLQLSEALAGQPQASIPKATGSWGQACAAYRFLDHTKFTPHDILRPHFLQTRERAATRKRVLAVADTTSLNYGQSPQTQGLGLIGGRADKIFGLMLQCLLTFTPEGLPLGLLDTQCWARDPAKFGGNRQRNRKPVADKESSKWLHSYRALQQHALQTPDTQWVMVADREADLYELFALALATPDSPDLLVRVQHDRGVEQSARRLYAHLTRTPVAGRLTVVLPRKAGQRARSARLSVRFQEVRLSAPLLKSGQPPLTLWAIEAREARAPHGCSSLHWRLLTTCPVTTLAQATEIIGWYRVRWGIEVFHKVLKSGCGVESAQLETADRLQRYLAIKLVIAWQVMALTHLGRAQAEAQMDDILEEGQWEVLRAATVVKGEVTGSPPSAHEAVRRLGRMGGHLGRRGDGHPGPLCLARGL